MLGLEHLLPGGERLVDLAPGAADPLAGLLAGLRRQRADLPVGQRERRPVARVLGPDPLQVLQVGRCSDRGEGRVPGRIDLFRLHGSNLHGVVIGIGSGHGRQSRNRRSLAANGLPGVDGPGRP